MKKLEILLLGPPEVRWESKKIDILRRIPRALLFYLASKGNPVGREELSSLFWGNKADSHARRRLQENLSRLRKALPDSSLLQTTADTVELDSYRIYVDSIAFEDILDQTGKIPWQIPQTDPLPDPIFDKLKSAINIWRGAGFLSGSYFPGTVELDNWLTRTSSHYNYLRGSILERLAYHAYTIGDLETSLSYCQALFDIEPLHDDFHFLYLQSLIELGRTNAAKTHFGKTVDLYVQLLNTNPPDKILALSRYFKPSDNEASVPTPPNWHLHNSIEMPFIGRKEILLQLRHWVNQRKGVFILGESGSGKTRLIRKYTNDLSIIKSVRVIVSSCRPEEISLPYQPIREALRMYMTSEEWQAIPDVWAVNLLGIFPELIDLRPNLIHPQLPSDPDQAQGLLLEAVRQAFMALKADSRLFFVIDDLHWADEATLNALAFLLPREPFSNQASIITAARSEDLSPQLEHSLTSIQQSKDGAIINLPGMTDKEIADLAKSVLAIIPPYSFTERLSRASGGNTLYLLETLRAIINQNPDLDFSDEIPLPVTENLRKLISNRIQKLSKSTRRIMEAASVIGHDFDPKIIISILEQDENEIIDALDELENKNFITIPPEKQSTGIYSFVHETIREALQAEINLTRARYLNTKVAQELENKLGDILIHRLAHHYEAAGEYLRAFRLWIRAGNQARELIATQEAYSLYQRARDLFGIVENEILEADIYNLYVQWSEIAYNFNETTLLNKLGEELKEIGEKRNSPSLMGTAYDILSNACFTVNDLTGGLENASSAIAHLEKSNNLARNIQAYNHQGVFYYMLGQLSQAKESFEDALALSTASRSRKVIGYRSHSHYQMALIRTFEGYPEQGRNHALWAIKDGEESDPYLALFPGYSISALTHYYTGDYVQSQKHAQLGLELGSKTRAVRLLGYTHSYASMSALGMGEIGSAVDHAEKAIDIGGKYELDDVAALGYSQLGSAYRILLDYPAAIDAYQRGVKLGTGHFIGLDNAFRHGLALHSMGQIDEGYRLLKQALNGFKSIGIKLGTILTQISMTLTFMRAAEWEKARKLAHLLEEETSSRSMGVHYALVMMLLGQLSKHDGKPEIAQQYFHKANQIARQKLSPTIELGSNYQLFKIVDNAEKAVIRKRTMEIIDQIGSSIKRPENKERFKKVQEKAFQEVS